jgi:hypothetical protein
MNDILRMVSGAPIKHRGAGVPSPGLPPGAGKRGTAYLPEQVGPKVGEARDSQV